MMKPTSLIPWKLIPWKLIQQSNRPIEIVEADDFGNHTTSASLLKTGRVGGT